MAHFPDNWLVKSNGRILGPYTHQKVSDILQSREIVDVDEVSQPFGRWRVIKEVADFSIVLEEIRQQQFEGGEDNTWTATMEIHAGSLTETIDSDQDALTDGLTDELTPQQITPTQPNEIVYESILEKKDPRRNSSRGQYQYAGAEQMAVKKGVQKKHRHIWYVTIGFLLLLVSLVAYREYIKSPKDAVESASTWKKDALLNLKLGDYDEALRLFKKVNSLSPEDRSIYIYLGTLLIQQESQTVVAKRLLTEVIQFQPNFAREAWTAIGLAELQDRSLEKANSAFDKALDADPGFVPAMINLGVVSYLDQNYERALSFFNRALRSGATDGSLFLLFTAAYVNLFKQTSSVDLLVQAQQKLTDYLRNSTDYTQEVQLASAYLNFLSGGHQTAELQLTNLLDQDPRLTSDHRHNLFVHRELVGWNQLSHWCGELHKGLDPTAFINAFHAFCLTKAGKALEAEPLARQAVNAAPKNALVQAIFSYNLDHLGQEEKSSVALGRASELDRSLEYKLPSILQARFCQSSKDWSCAQDFWSKLAHKDSRSLTAFAGLVQVALEMGNLKEAEYYLTQGFRLSTDYKPLLQARQAARRMGVRF